MIPKTVVFRHKRYTRAYTKDTFSAAKKEATSLHEIGSAAIIRQYDNKYVVYARH